LKKTTSEYKRHAILYASAKSDAGFQKSIVNNPFFDEDD